MEVIALIAIIVGIPFAALYLGLRFWRALLSLVAALALVAAMHQLYQIYQRHTAEQRIADAQAAPKPKTWEVWNQEDPATGRLQPRVAFVESEDGLCSLSVEQRLNRVRLASVACPGLPIRFNHANSFIGRLFETVTDDATQMGVKFDTMKSSTTMAVSRFNDVEDDESFYTDSDSDGPGNLPYEAFIRRIASSEKLALELDFRYGGRAWIRFSLDGSRAALTQIGAVPKAPARRRLGEPNPLEQIIDARS